MNRQQPRREEVWQERSVQLARARRALGAGISRVARLSGLDPKSIRTYETLKRAPSGPSLEAWEGAILWLAEVSRARAGAALRSVGAR
jgi:hypothetical protein